MRYYSQAGQDEWVVNFFNSKKNGFFLDIGAHNGVDISNSYYLEKYLGWNGICIEADPNIFNTLQNNRNCHCINIAVSDSVGEISFFQDNFSGRVLESTSSIKLKSDTLENILSETNCPDVIEYLSIDIEGFESKALSKFPFSKKEIVLLTVEHNLYTGNLINKQEIKDILTKNGYTIAVENVKHNNCEFEDWYINTKYKI